MVRRLRKRFGVVLRAEVAHTTFRRKLTKYASPKVLVIDEVGFLPVDKHGADLLFQVIARRHDARRPTVATSNRPPSHWDQVFHAEAIAHAIADRLFERAEVFVLEAPICSRPHYRA